MSEIKSEVPDWMPEIWDDEVQMRGLMSSIKSKTANAADYNRKMKFWTSAISGKCEATNNATFSIADLKKTFKRGNMIPASLGVIVEEMKSRGEIVTLNEWKSKHSGWMDWGLSKTKGWMFGTATDTDKDVLIHLPTVEKKAAELLEYYNSELREDFDCPGEVITYSEMWEKSKEFAKDVTTFDILLEHLTDAGQLSTGHTQSGEKLLKFKAIGSVGPAKLTESDHSVVNIRKAMGKLDREIQQLEAKAEKLKEQVRMALRGGDKTRATNLLRQKKQAEKNASDKDAQYQKLLAMLHQISNASNNKHVLDAYKSGTAAFKATLEQHGLSVDAAHETIDGITEALDDQREIDEAISSPIAGHNRTTDAELEDELEMLLAENKKGQKTEFDFPMPPSNRFGLVEPEVEEMSLEKRLERLRAQC